jgi:O-phosphoseryl-tRNA(Cys) synthetase
LKMISPGKVYRRDTDDATHSHQFHQVEGIVVGEHVTMADLKGTLEVVAQNLFGDQLKVRLRPSYFRSRNRPSRPTSLALIAWGPVAQSVRGLVGSRCWGLEWCTQTS